MRSILIFLLAFPALCPAQEGQEFLMGAVVKSDKWKMDRANNLETFTGNVSFRNPRYTFKADHAVYDRAGKTWDLKGSVYTLRSFADSSQIEVNCGQARYLETLEEAYLERSALPVRMKYKGPDGRILSGRSDRARAENKSGLMFFTGSFALSTENLDMHSNESLYDNIRNTFLLYDSTAPAADLPAGKASPVAVGKKEGYDFAIAAESIKFFRDSRDIKFYNRVAGWVKDVPPPTEIVAPKKL